MQVLIIKDLSAVLVSDLATFLLIHLAVDCTSPGNAMDIKYNKFA